MDSQASLGGRGREGVRIGESDEGTRPGRRVASEIVSGELSEGVESEEGEKGEEVREEGDKEAGGGGGRRGVGSGVGGRGGDGGGGGSAVVKKLEVASVAKPGFEGGFGNTES